MKSYIYLLVFILLGTVAYGGTQSIAIVKGQVLSPRGSTIKLATVSDYITHEPMEYTLDLDANGNFKFEVSVNAPKVATLYHGNGSMELFLEPNEVLGMTFDAWDITATIEFNGSGADNNAYLNLFNQRFSRLNDDYVIYKMASLNPDEFQQLMRKKRQEKNAFLQMQKKHFEFTKNFKDYAEADIEYWWAHHLMRYRWENAYYNNLEPPLKLPIEYFNFLTEVKISNDAAIYNQKYLFFLDQYLEFQNNRIRILLGVNWKPPKYRGAEDYLEGSAKYFVLATEYYLKCKSKQTYTIGNDVRRFLEECTDENYKDLVRSEYKRANGLEAGTPAPNFTLVDAEGREVSLDDFNGKVVYMDFWATWCVPCTYEIMKSKELKKRFQGRDVIFLYISLDTNPDSWRNFLATKQPAGIHLFAKNVYESDVARLYGVRGLPSFFLIDKGGNLARVPAKRSSEPGVYKEINEVLLAK